MNGRKGAEKVAIKGRERNEVYLKSLTRIIPPPLDRNNIRLLGIFTETLILEIQHPVAEIFDFVFRKGGQ